MSESLDAHLERTPDGWQIRVPLRREDVQIEKRTVVGERVVVRRAAMNDVRQVSASVKREQLRVAEHDADATQPIERPSHRDTLAGSGMDQDPLS